MNEKELLENKILCLKQLRLTKWQLIWNREFELSFMDEVEKAAMVSLELSAKLPSDEIARRKQNLQVSMATKEGEIVKAKKEIEKLDLIINQLEKQQNEKVSDNNSGN